MPRCYCSSIDKKNKNRSRINKGRKSSKHLRSFNLVVSYEIGRGIKMAKRLRSVRERERVRKCNVSQTLPCVTRFLHQVHLNSFQSAFDIHLSVNFK